MRQLGVAVVSAFVAASCSIIYNPDNIHKPPDAAFFDGRPDAPPIDANQAGNGEYRRGAQVQQSFAVGPAPLAPLVPAASSALGFTTSSPAPPTSSFTLVGAPSINRSTGALTFTARVANAGTMMWTLTFANGSFGVVQSRAGCRDALRIGPEVRCAQREVGGVRDAQRAGQVHDR